MNAMPSTQTTTMTTPTRDSAFAMKDKTNSVVTNDTKDDAATTTKPNTLNKHHPTIETVPTNCNGTSMDESHSIGATSPPPQASTPTGKSNTVTPTSSNKKKKGRSRAQRKARAAARANTPQATTTTPTKNTNNGTDPTATETENGTTMEGNDEPRAALFANNNDDDNSRANGTFDSTGQVDKTIEASYLSMLERPPAEESMHPHKRLLEDNRRLRNKVAHISRAWKQSRYQNGKLVAFVNWLTTEHDKIKAKHRELEAMHVEVRNEMKEIIEISKLPALLSSLCDMFAHSDGKQDQTKSADN